MHAIDCPALVEFEEQPNRWVDLHWHAGRHKAVNTVGLELTISVSYTHLDVYKRQS